MHVLCVIPTVRRSFLLDEDRHDFLESASCRNSGNSSNATNPGVNVSADISAGTMSNTIRMVTRAQQILGLI